MTRQNFPHSNLLIEFKKNKWNVSLLTKNIYEILVYRLKLWMKCQFMD